MTKGGHYAEYMAAVTTTHIDVRADVPVLGSDASHASEHETAASKSRVSHTDVLTTMWLAVAAAWTVYFLHGLIDSRSVIVHLEQELGRTVDLSRGPVVGFTELHGAFCGHGFRGEEVNSTFSNWIGLFLGGAVAYVPGLALLSVNVSRWARQRSRRLTLAMAAIVVVQVGLMITFADTIGVATYFGD